MRKTEEISAYPECLEFLSWINGPRGIKHGLVPEWFGLIDSEHDNRTEYNWQEKRPRNLDGWEFGKGALSANYIFSTTTPRPRAGKNLVLV